MTHAIRRLVASLFEAGIRDWHNLKNAATSTNYALFGTPREAMYGEHLKRFCVIKRKYGPENVMRLGRRMENLNVWFEGFISL